MFKNNLKYYRIKKNLTLKDLANNLGVTTDYIRMIENGKRNPGIFLAKNISEIFDMSIEEIFFTKKTNK